MQTLIKVARAIFTASLALLLTASTLPILTASAETPIAQPQATRKIAIYDFANGSTIPQPSTVDTVCDSATVTTDTSTTLLKYLDLPSTITGEITKKLTSKYEVLPAPPTASIEGGTLVLSGCITEANPGNAAKRLVGMGMGSSRLAAHVVVSLQTSSGLVPVRAFDVAVKGSNLLPPLGPAGLVVHAAKEVHQTMDSLAKKLASQVAKQLNKKDSQLSSTTFTTTTANREAYYVSSPAHKA